MNYALIIAGGSGNRMGQDIPKQFINVYWITGSLSDHFSRQTKYKWKYK